METIIGQPLDVLIPLARREEGPDFGAWQAWFQECFPEWRKNLAFPEPEYREGVFIFKAKLGSVWRRIAIPAACNLDALARAILRAFKFDGDHLYDFCFPGRDGSQVRVVCPYIDDAEAWTDDYSIGDLPLAGRPVHGVQLRLRGQLALRRETGEGGAAQSADEKAPAGGIAGKAAQGV